MNDQIVRGREHKVSCHGIAKFIERFSLEIMPRDREAVRVASERCPSKTDIYIACPPREAHSSIVSTAVEVSRLGFVPIPHIVARGLRSEQQLDDLLARIRGETGTTRVLVLGGDISRPVGKFHSSLDLLKTGLFQKHDFRSIGLATYPEGHPRVDNTALDAALIEKIGIASMQRLQSWLVSQFCFDSSLVLEHVRRLRTLGVTSPAHIGVAGLASYKTLMKFAILCGVGNSSRALILQSQRFGRLLGNYDPASLVERIAEGAVRDPELNISSAHFFTFGGVALTLQWLGEFLLQHRSAS